MYDMHTIQKLWGTALVVVDTTLKKTDWGHHEQFKEHGALSQSGLTITIMTVNEGGHEIRP